MQDSVNRAYQNDPKQTPNFNWAYVETTDENGQPIKVYLAFQQSYSSQSGDYAETPFPLAYNKDCNPQLTSGEIQWRQHDASQVAPGFEVSP